MGEESDVDDKEREVSGSDLILPFIIQFSKERAEYAQEREKYEAVFGQ